MFQALASHLLLQSSFPTVSSLVKRSSQTSIQLLAAAAAKSPKRQCQAKLKLRRIDWRPRLLSLPKVSPQYSSCTRDRPPRSRWSLCSNTTPSTQRTPAKFSTGFGARRIASSSRRRQRISSSSRRTASPPARIKIPMITNLTTKKLVLIKKFQILAINCKYKSQKSKRKSAKYS